MLITESMLEDINKGGWIRVFCRILVAMMLVCNAVGKPVLSTEMYEFDISHKQLGMALVAMAKQSQSQLLFPYHMAKSPGMNPVVGRYTISDALEKMLRSSGFSGGLTERGIITITRNNVKKKPKREAHVTVSQRKKTLLTTISALIFGASSAGVAVDAEIDTDTVFEMEEVVVVARKRAESLQSVPIAITAVTAETIERVGALSLSDLSAISPSAEISPSGFITLRGVGDFSRNIGSGARAVVYVDGAPVGRSYAFEQDLLDVERVEILRGPQGTLFGKNSVSGAINIITKKPHDQFEGEIVAEYGSKERVQLASRVNVPLGDTVFLSVQGGYFNKNGLFNNLASGNNLGGNDRYSARVKLLVNVSESLELMFSADYLEESTLSSTLDAIEGPGFIEAPEFNEVRQSFDGVREREYKAGTFHLNYDFENGYALTAISSYRENNFEASGEEDYSSLRIASSFFDETSDQFSQEIRIASPADGNYDFIVGAFYATESLESGRSARAEPQFTGLPFDIFVRTPGTLSDESISGFAHGNYRFTDKLELSAGLRYTHQERSIVYSSFDQIGLFTTFENFQETKTDNEWSPKVTLNYQIDEDVFSYVTYSRTFKSGGWNADFITTIEGIGFDPEYAKNYEVGLKSTLFDNRLRINLAGFVTKFTDYQVFQFIPLANGGTIITTTNAGEVTTRGLEVETIALPAEGLTLTFSYSLIDAYYNRFRDGGGPGVDYDGNKLTNTAKHNVYASVDYQIDVTADTYLTLHTDYTFRASRFGNVANTELARVAERHLVNARIGLINEESGLELYLWADNVFNQKYLSSITRSFSGTLVQAQTEGSSVGVKARYRF
ncbi:MAG: TonB-dependent receptor [Kordiimonadaceae bacterium]|nr:TonB-dependent receptor [Kordiimonadaceae bacterium]